MEYGRYWRTGSSLPVSSLRWSSHTWSGYRQSAFLANLEDGLQSCSEHITALLSTTLAILQISVWTGSCSHRKLLVPPIVGIWSLHHLLRLRLQYRHALVSRTNADIDESSARFNMLTSDALPYSRSSIAVRGVARDVPLVQR